MTNNDKSKLTPEDKDRQVMRAVAILAASILNHGAGAHFAMGTAEQFMRWIETGEKK